MNIIVVSRLKGDLLSGPEYSVPSQILSLSEFDNVFWYNMNTANRSEWINSKCPCHNLSDYPSGSIKDLPEPFNNPDIVIFEELYCYPWYRIVFDVWKMKIPYIIIPRSSMTDSAQQQSFLKKYIANVLFFNRFINKSSGIQFLTQSESNNSSKWKNINSFVIPNGIELHDEMCCQDINSGIKVVYIGRLDINHKGLDILIKSVASIKDILLNNNFHLLIAGPDKDGASSLLSEMINKYGVNNLVTLSGPLRGEEKKIKLLNSNMFIMTSRFEGLPMGMIEAMSYGMPILATEGTNMTDVITSNNIGWCANNSVESVSMMLRHMLNDLSTFKEKSYNSKKASLDFSWLNIAQQSHCEYENIVKTNKL